jgi:hypothetical protein
MNPAGDPNSWGTLRKSGGANVEGYSEDAIVFGSDPSNLSNVVDIVGGAGANGARLGWINQPRRSGDTWEAPKALTIEQMDYLKSGSHNSPPQPPIPIPPPSPQVCKYALPPDYAETLAMIVERLDQVSAAVAEADKHANLALLESQDIQKKLAAGLQLDASTKFLGAVRGTVKWAQ